MKIFQFTFLAVIGLLTSACSTIDISEGNASLANCYSESKISDGKIVRVIPLGKLKRAKKPCNIDQMSFSVKEEGEYQPNYPIISADEKSKNKNSESLKTQEEINFATFKAEEYQVKKIMNYLKKATYDCVADSKPVKCESLYDDAFDEASPKKKKMPIKILIFAHGGLVEHENAVASAEYMAPKMIADGFTPLFLFWDSDFTSSYGQAISNIQDGEHENIGVLWDAPTRVFGDVGTSIVRAPENLGKQLWRWTQTDVVKKNKNFSQFKADNYDAKSAPPYLLNPNPLDKKEEKCREFWDFASTDSPRDCANLIFPGLGHAGSFEQNKLLINGYAPSGTDIAGNTILLLPRTVVSAVGLGIGTRSWDNMIRRSKIAFSQRLKTNYECDASNQCDGTDTEKLKKLLTRTNESKDGQFKDGSDGAFYRFFERLESVVSTGILDSENGARPEFYFFGHSMGTIVGNEILYRFHRLNFKDIVYMAGAASIRDTNLALTEALNSEKSSVEKYCPEALDLKRCPKPKFYDLVLHPLSESRETGENYFSLQSFTPRGSLLEWIDEYFEGPRLPYDKTVGKWNNMKKSSYNLQGDVRMNTTILVFPPRLSEKIWNSHPDSANCAESGNEICYPIRHGDFDDFTFWRPEFYKGKGKSNKNFQ